MTKALHDDIIEKYNLNYELVSIDDFLKMTTNNTLYEDEVYDISGDLCTMGLEKLNLCKGLLIDHVITSERIFLHLKKMFAKYPIYLIHVTCPLNVLVKREQELRI